MITPPALCTAARLRSVLVVMPPTSPCEGGCCLARTVDQQSVVSSDRVGLFMPPSVSRLAVEGVCCGEVPAADGSWSLQL